MPLINGMKMACEPCIRGHRSTKCTHANERLMVPVRKPGRPLSQCPHPGGQNCMCGSVTAAIPRKQTCHCGDGSSPAPTAQIVPRTTSQEVDALSPTRPSFKIQKTSRPQSGRKQSFDPANFERMDMNSINVLPFEQRGQVPMGMALPEGYAVSAPPPQMYGYAPQYASMQPQYPVPMQPPPMPHEMSHPHEIQTNGFANGIRSRNGSYAVESPVTPTIHTNGNGIKATNGGSCCAPKSTSNGANGESKLASNGGSCCAPKQNGHSHSSSNGSSNSDPEEPQVSSCCSSKPPQLKEEPLSMSSTPIHMSPATPHQMLPQSGMPLNAALYQQFLPPNTYTYPPTYGSFQNPLQFADWRQGIRSNNYTQSQPPVLTNGALPFGAPLMPESMETVHTCGCGDGCQCVGCAAHPFNNATQDYVRSAYASMSVEQPRELYTNGQPTPITNGNTPMQPQNVDPVSSPTAHTPTSTTSGNGEEQSLSASDFFFVNYPFSGDDGCGGDTMSCPCGDDCQCLGCTIHRQPSMPCAGDKDGCPCGDDCACIGCTIHNNGPVI
ncbi:Protein GRISEA [Lachnellula suecica]|uniref:Protein GRISEA n=1 Tax=Lachnellula suecica TaxID=602035 RepID=A0A8T9BSI0_9HELO|nr:Protein GRISEA [Lachnellula suecica]